MSAMFEYPSVHNLAAFLHGYEKIISYYKSKRLQSGKLSLIGNEDPRDLQKLLLYSRNEVYVKCSSTDWLVQSIKHLFTATRANLGFQLGMTWRLDHCR